MDPNQKKTKLLAQRAHARRRAEERYGFILTKDKRRDIITMIQRGASQPIEKQSHRIGIHLVQYEGLTIKLVYDKVRKNIVTLLPLEDTRGKE